MLKMDRTECEEMLNGHGKQQQYVIRESKKVQNKKFTHAESL